MFSSVLFSPKYFHVMCKFSKFFFFAFVGQLAITFRGTLHSNPQNQFSPAMPRNQCPTGMPQN
jgi:hypothetical protein